MHGVVSVISTQLFQSAIESTDAVCPEPGLIELENVGHVGSLLEYSL